VKKSNGPGTSDKKKNPRSGRGGQGNSRGIKKPATARGEKVRRNARGTEIQQSPEKTRICKHPGDKIKVFRRSKRPQTRGTEQPHIGKNTWGRWVGEQTTL